MTKAEPLSSGITNNSQNLRRSSIDQQLELVPSQPQPANVQSLVAKKARKVAYPEPKENTTLTSQGDSLVFLIPAEAKRAQKSSKSASRKAIPNDRLAQLNNDPSQLLSYLKSNNMLKEHPLESITVLQGQSAAPQQVESPFKRTSHLRPFQPDPKEGGTHQS